ncbi:uncharacterized protein LOC121706390 [Alosa sapidissima]|uniref:uncharacterized protein LOC121706390 n=1 Tax=Alosa sapidissima TaxID=34773 RepID=UPI001C09CCB5|nr:uncharacterized protein LOC121706390 [Alosa sapidissima]
MCTMLRKVAILVSCIAYVFGKKLLCSSDSVTIWYTYEVSPVSSIGATVSVWSKGVKWFEVHHRTEPCEYFKICQLIKGESFRDTIPLYTKSFHQQLTPGTYLVFVKLFRPETFLQLNITMDIKEK